MRPAVREWWPLAALALAAAWLGPSMIDLFFNRMTFQPQPGEPARGLRGPVEEVTLTTADGVRIHGFYLPRPDSDRALLMLHGNYGNATDRLPFGERLADLGLSVLVLDYRGYGYSEGRPTESGVYLDADAGFRHLVDDRGFPPERIVVLGRSLGGAVAVELLGRETAGGLVLISTLRSARAMAGSMGLGWLAPLVGDRLDTESRIAALNVPVLLFHGEADEIVPFEHGEILYKRAREPKRLHPIPGAMHNDIIEVAGRRFWEPLAAFLDEVAPLSPPTGP